MVLNDSSPLFAADAPFDFHSGDRVVFLGGSLTERERDFGFLETAITSALPKLEITFRHIPANPASDATSTIDLVRKLKPTIVFLTCGARDVLAAGDSGLTDFVAEQDQLLSDLAPLDCRLVFMTPPQLETPAADVNRQNQLLGKYAQAIRELADHHGGRLVDLYDRTAPITLNQPGSPSPGITGPEAPRGFQLVDGAWRSLPLTTNGTDLSPYGCHRVARMVVHELRLPKAEFLLHLASDGDPESDVQTLVSDFHSDGKQVKFQLLLARLPEPPTPIFPRDTEYFSIAGGGLPSGHYELKIDGRVAAVNPTILVGFPVRGGADFEQAERLRQFVVAKNWLLTWPGREHAASRFDPLVAHFEREIATLKKPIARQYEVLPRIVEEKK